jgi:hypothetical protein
LQLGKYTEGLEFAMRAYHLDPLDNRLSEHVTQLRAKIHKEETGTNQSKENESRSERWTSRRRLSDLLFRSELDYNDVGLDMQGSDRDDVDYFDNDMEMEVEMSAGGMERGIGKMGDGLGLSDYDQGEIWVNRKVLEVVLLGSP